MMMSLSQNRQVLELVKNDDHFVLVYPNTQVGRAAAKGAMWKWLMDCELDFNRSDAELFKKAIDANRLQLTLNHQSARALRWGRRRL